MFKKWAKKIAACLLLGLTIQSAAMGGACFFCKHMDVLSKETSIITFDVCGRGGPSMCEQEADVLFTNIAVTSNFFPSKEFFPPTTAMAVITAYAVDVEKPPEA